MVGYIVGYKDELLKKRYAVPSVPLKLAVPTIWEGKCIGGIASSHLHPKVLLWKKKIRLKRLFKQNKKTPN